MKSFILFGFALILAPFMPALILRVKAIFAGKQGPPLLINYFTLAKLLSKGSIYSNSTTFVFRLAPVVSLAVIFFAFLFMPMAGVPPIISFQGDVVLVFYLLGLGRFCTIIAALDTASPFEGMGAAREAYFATLAEATVFVVLILFYRLTGSLSLADFFADAGNINLWHTEGVLLILVIVAMFLVLLTENSRVPVDDPATHLELTMIHEVMILDHSGPDLAFIELGSYLKLFFYGSFITGIILPKHSGLTVGNIVLFYGVLATVYISVGVLESITARFRMSLVPKFILTSFALAFFATILAMEFAK